MKELITLSLTGVFIMLADILNIKRVNFLLALLGTTTTAVFCIYDWGITQHVTTMMTFDKYAQAFTLIMCAVAFLWMLMSEDAFDKINPYTITGFPRGDGRRGKFHFRLSDTAKRTSPCNRKSQRHLR